MNRGFVSLGGGVHRVLELRDLLVGELVQIILVLALLRPIRFLWFQDFVDSPVKCRLPGCDRPMSQSIRVGE